MANPTPGAPVPPDDDWLMASDSARFLLAPPAPAVVGELIAIIRAMKAEREGLAELIQELNGEVLSLLRLLEVLGHDLRCCSDTYKDLDARARAATERLRGGDSDG